MRLVPNSIPLPLLCHREIARLQHASSSLAVVDLDPIPEADPFADRVPRRGHKLLIQMQIKIEFHKLTKSQLQS